MNKIKKPVKLTRKMLAKSFPGDWNGKWLNIAGPGHKKGDRSLGIMFDPGEPDGFRLNSLAGDDEVECRKHVKGLLKKIVEGGSLTVENDAGQDDGLATQKKIAFALTIWEEAIP